MRLSSVRVARLVDMVSAKAVMSLSTFDAFNPHSRPSLEKLRLSDHDHALRVFLLLLPRSGTAQQSVTSQRLHIPVFDYLIHVEATLTLAGQPA
jgi:hypothetical protein